MKKRVNIFGTTGSIGQNTLSVFRENRDLYDFMVFSAHENVDQLIDDCIEFKPKYANMETKIII